ncbi:MULTISPECIES: hypothetical protein [Streptosporangium]|uniref:DUF4376 domain-containing protein n=1 Tax=Streptosporangium brasiliense TaxID=47480 RepID=A0ABT9RQ29_9ACTN|nr:hypothetical protein [Streptosporangium brasiliense]MDP9870395.1 hypothetical protein [Streptosporangium brasiliense]
MEQTTVDQQISEAEQRAALAQTRADWEKFDGIRQRVNAMDIMVDALRGKTADGPWLITAGAIRVKDLEKLVTLAEIALRVHREIQSCADQQIPLEGRESELAFDLWNRVNTLNAQQSE